MAVTCAAPEHALPLLEGHPHARAVLEPALPPGAASHAYLFYGPAGSGKRSVARAFASALLADGAADEAAAAGRVERGTHPDLTWVRPSGAAEMLVSDVEGPVVEAAARTPFESRRRVFVIEAADTMNDQTANRMLKTLEEPLQYVHLMLLAHDHRAVLPTIASRCQLVRFDAPPPERIAAGLEAEDIAPARALACARLALGDTRLARWLAGEEGEALRSRISAWVEAAMEGELDDGPWLDLLEAARAEGQRAATQTRAALAERLELLPEKERRRYVREGTDAERRAERRRRAGVLDVALRLAELWLRDAWCIAVGADAVVHALDREDALRAAARDRDGSVLRGAVEMVAETRMRLPLNVSEELALETLSYRLASLLAR